MIFLFALFVSSFSQAASTEYFCQGIRGSEGTALYVRTIAPRRVSDGDTFSVFVELSRKDQVLFAGMGKGEIEDVNFQFSARSEQKLTGHIYLDEMDQTSVTWNGQNFDFDCSYDRQ
jgi:hypothetical protein